MKMSSDLDPQFNQFYVYDVTADFFGEPITLKFNRYTRFYPGSVNNIDTIEKIFYYNGNIAVAGTGNIKDDKRDILVNPAFYAENRNEALCFVAIFIIINYLEAVKNAPRYNYDGIINNNINPEDSF